MLGVRGFSRGGGGTPILKDWGAIGEGTEEVEDNFEPSILFGSLL